MMKKTMMSLVLAMALLLFALPAMAAGSEDGEACAVSGCTGTYQNGFCSACDGYQEPAVAPSGAYYLGNAGNLYWFANQVNTVTDGVYLDARLTADITVNEQVLDSNGSLVSNAASLRSWTPIAKDTERSYQGMFVGNGYTISGLYCKVTSGSNIYAGLFGQMVNTQLSSLRLTDSYFEANASSGAALAGGFAGYAMGVGFYNCYNEATVYATAEDAQAGGIAGHSRENSFYECINSGSVSAGGVSPTAGGLTGLATRLPGTSGSNGITTINCCVNTGKVTANSGAAGALAGYVAAAQITNSYYDTASCANAYNDNTGSFIIEGDLAYKYYSNVVGKTSTEIASGSVCTALGCHLSARENGVSTCLLCGSKCTSHSFTNGNNCDTCRLPVIFAEGLVGNVPAVLEKGKSITLPTTVTPANATHGGVTWSITSGANYATLSGNTLTGNNPGTVKLRATIKYGQGDTDLKLDYSLSVVGSLSEYNLSNISSWFNNGYVVYLYIEDAGNNQLKITYNGTPEYITVPADQAISFTGSLVGSETSYPSFQIKVLSGSPHLVFTDVTLKTRLFPVSVEGGSPTMTFVGNNTIQSINSNTRAFSVTGSSTTLTLNGNGTLNAKGGISANNSSNIAQQITIDGSLNINADASGVNYAAGIGASNVIIHGGTINVKGGSNAGAGIGGCSVAASTVTINGGTINATGGSGNTSNGYGGAGIGGGANASGTVIINGGVITATGGSAYAAGAGIGGGNNASGTVTINGGTITATGGTGRYPGKAIGDGGNRNNSTVTITGGSVNATGFTATNGSANGSATVTQKVLSIPELTDDESITAAAGLPDYYGLNDVQTLDGKLYFYLPGDYPTSVTDEGGTTYKHAGSGVYATHVHNWVYAASGDTITATCNASGCTGSYGGSVTIKPPASNVYTGDPIVATLDNTLTTGAAVGNITYTANTGALTGDQPVNAGSYTASVSVEGETASATFDVVYQITLNAGAHGTLTGDSAVKTGVDGKLTALPADPTVNDETYTFTGWYDAAEGGSKITTDTVFSSNATIYAQYQDHQHNWSYSASGKTITATCQNANCPLTDNKVIITLTAPDSSTLTYDGQAKQATVTQNPEGTIANLPAVSYSGRNNTQYAASTTAPTDAGDYTASLTLGEDGNTATAQVEYTIKPLDITNATVNVSGTYSYTGSSITPDEANVSVTLTGTALNPEDYSVSASNNTNAGTATVTVTGEGNYTGTASGTFTIGPKVVDNPTIVLEPSSFVYDGQAKEPAVTVKDGEVTIAASEYTVEYSNNTNAADSGAENAPTVTITDIVGGNYTVSGTATFSITQTTTVMTAKADQAEYTYGDTITVTGEATLPKQEEQSFNLLRAFTGPTAQQVALYDATGTTQLTDGVDVVNGEYTITYDTKNKGIQPGENIYLMICP